MTRLKIPGLRNVTFCSHWALPCACKPESCNSRTPLPTRQTAKPMGGSDSERLMPKNSRVDVMMGLCHKGSQKSGGGQSSAWQGRLQFVKLQSDKSWRFSPTVIGQARTVALSLQQRFLSVASPAGYGSLLCHFLDQTSPCLLPSKGLWPTILIPARNQ